MSPFNFNEIKVFDNMDNIDIIRTIINMENQEDAFYIVDIGDVIQKHYDWMKKMPRVVPHFGIYPLCHYVFSVSQIIYDVF